MIRGLIARAYSAMKTPFPTLFAQAAVGLVLVSMTPTAEGAPPYIFTGDGLTVVVLREDEDTGQLAGNLRLGSRTHPFQGVAEESEAGSTVSGSFSVEGGAQPFAATLSADGTRVTFSFGGKIYRLAKTDRVPPVPPATDPPPAGPREPRPPRPAAKEESPPTAPAAAEEDASPAEPPLALKRVEFPDVNMGNVPAYSMLIPSGWRVDQGHIAWANDYPQPHIRVLGPDHEKIAYVPFMTFSYLESSFTAPQGTPPPERLGEWLVSYITQNNREVADVTLIEDRRDPQAEAAAAKSSRELGVSTDIRQQSHVITIEYDKDGARLREEVRLDYSRLPPLVTQTTRTMTWTLYARSLVAARADRFAALHPRLLTLSGTFLTLPKWWTQMMQVRSELIQKRHRDGMEAIRRRGQLYDQMSDAQFAAWKKWNRSDDEIHRRRIQGINEVTDFQDRDGRTVELPFHYKHVFSDGEGNYILSNRYQKPGARFEEIQPAR